MWSYLEQGCTILCSMLYIYIIEQNNKKSCPALYQRWGGFFPLSCQHWGETLLVFKSDSLNVELLYDYLSCVCQLVHSICFWVPPSSGLKKTEAKRNLHVSHSFILELCISIVRELHSCLKDELIHLSLPHLLFYVSRYELIASKKLY